MNDKKLKELTASFPDIKPLVDGYKKTLKEAEKYRRKLKTKHKQYAFLKNLVNETKDETLENAICEYFKELGYNHIEKVGKKFKEEDLRLQLSDRLIIFEVSGSKNLHPSEEKLFQIRKHKPIREDEFTLDVYAVFLFNHRNQESFEQRPANPFLNKENLIYKNGITAATTNELLKAFLLIKNGKWSSSTLIERLCHPGVFRTERNNQSPLSKSVNK